MKHLYILLFILILIWESSIAIGAKSSDKLEQRRAQLLKVPSENIENTKKERPLINIISLDKGRASNWVWKDNDFGANGVATIDATFKINQKGEFTFPTIKVYVYDKNGLVVYEGKDAFNAVQSNKEIKELTNYTFKGRQPHKISFPVPNSIRYKEAVFVIGNEQEVFVKALGNATDPLSFDFPEKKLVKIKNS